MLMLMLSPFRWLDSHDSMVCHVQVCRQTTARICMWDSNSSAQVFALAGRLLGLFLLAAFRRDARTLVPCLAEGCAAASAP